MPSNLVTATSGVDSLPIPPIVHVRTSKPRPSTSNGNETLKRNQLSWPSVIWLTIAHLGLLAAPFTFTWQALVLVLVLHWLTGGIGVCLGFHRYLTHSSFQTYPAVRWFLAWLGGLAGEGSAVDWVADHRQHHALSDQVGDPHSPHDGPWWSHMFWLAWGYGRDNHQRHVQRWAPDLARDRAVRLIGKTFLLWHFLLGAILFGMGYWLGGSPMAWSFLVWGVFVRLCFVLHSTWFVNSASHMWGYRNYETTDDSRNNWWVALLTYGEGWHNNHHAYPRMAPHGHRWWEIDTTFWSIRLMQCLGLAWNVVDYKTAAEKHQHDA
jgi:stearoyl-CoA desaturase (delta-9 desaturase)